MANGKDKNKTMVVSKPVHDRLTMKKMYYDVSTYEDVLVKLLDIVDSPEVKKLLLDK
jgi:hypothetical protein